MYNVRVRRYGLSAQRFLVMARRRPRHGATTFESEGY